LRYLIREAGPRRVPVGVILSSLARVPRAVSRSGRAAFIERDELGAEKVIVKRIPESWR
jgi:hypothetical protein